MVLRVIEQKIEALVEGVFGRAFRTNVQPVELARKLVKEMDDHRQVSVSRIYVPNEYSVLPLARRPRPVRGLRGVADHRAPGLPRRACTARVLRPPLRAEGADRHRRGPRGRRVRDRDPDGPAAAGRPPRGSLPRLRSRVRSDDDLQAVGAARDAGRIARRARRRAGARLPRRRRRAARPEQAAKRDRPLQGLRRAAGRPERLAPPRRGAPGGDGVLDRRPRLDERDRGQRPAGQAAQLDSGDTVTIGSTDLVFDLENA